MASHHMLTKPEEFGDIVDGDKNDELTSLHVYSVVQALHLHCSPDTLISEMRKLRHFSSFLSAIYHTLLT